MKRPLAFRGLQALAHDAVRATTDLVGEGRDASGRVAERLGALTPFAREVSAANRLQAAAFHGVLAAVKGINDVVAQVSDLAWAAHAADARDPPTTGFGEALQGALNGVVGDHLHRRGNPLGLGLSLRFRGDDVEGARVQARKVAVFVHGVATTEASWSFGAARFLGDATATFATLLERDLGFEPVHVRYNTGRKIDDNGSDLARALEAAIGDDVDEVVLIGHSMGGLVSCRATHHGKSVDAAWTRRLRRIVCLGSPHQGAPLEGLGVAATEFLGAIDLPATRILSKVLGVRSAGIRDLGPPGVPLESLDGIAIACIAGSITADPEHPVSRVLGDLLVWVPSAEGPVHARFPIHTARFGGVLHHQLQTHPDVYAQVRAFCAGAFAEDTAPVSSH